MSDPVSSAIARLQRRPRGRNVGTVRGLGAFSSRSAARPLPAAVVGPEASAGRSPRRSGSHHLNVVEDRGCELAEVAGRDE